MNDSRFFQFLNDYPVFPINGFVTNTLAFIPIFAMLYIANVVPLHNNCRYIICVWALTYGGLYIVQLIFAKLDYDNPTGYMPLNMVEPPYRFNLYEWHVRITTYSSSFEIALSVERMVATIDPKRYHSSKTAWKTLILVTILMMFTSYEVDAFVHSADHFVAGCILQGAIEVLVVLVGCVAARVCSVRYESMYGKATLNERYQVKEAYEMSKAMIPALIVSYFLKSSTIVLLYAYFTVREEYPYFISYLEAYYYTIYTINGTFSLCILLLKHPQLRKQTNRKLAPLCGLDTVEKISTTSNSAETEIYFTIMWQIAAAAVPILAVLAHFTSALNLILISLGGMVGYGIYRYYEFVARYPKGPFPLPFMGNVGLVDNPKLLHEALLKVGKQQPGIYTMFMPFPFVQITDYDVLREAFIGNGDDFSGRPQDKVIQSFSFAPNSGVINSTGAVWREQRRAAISILRDFGKNVMEQMVRSSVEDYLKHLDSIVDKSNVDMRWPIQVMVSNVINETLFGFRFKYDDCKPLMDYVLGFNKMLESSTDTIGAGLGMTFPFLCDLPLIGWYTFGKLRAQMDEINQYIVSNVGRALKGYNIEDEPTCFAHAYKQRMQDNKQLDDLNLMSTCADFFLAGQETTTKTLRWTMILMAKHQEVQEKLRQEILEVVGPDRLPTMADQVKMTYARACALELQRWANVFATNVQRMTTRDTIIRGQKIPAGTWVNGDIHYLLANDPIFVKPEEFRPERYLSEDGTNLRKASFEQVQSVQNREFFQNLVERTIPFSIGNRVCAGESFARVEIFLGLTGTVQHYRILPREGADIDLAPALTQSMIQPKSQGVRLERIA